MLEKIIPISYDISYSVEINFTNDRLFVDRNRVRDIHLHNHVNEYQNSKFLLTLKLSNPDKLLINNQIQRQAAYFQNFGSIKENNYKFDVRIQCYRYLLLEKEYSYKGCFLTTVDYEYQNQPDLMQIGITYDYIESENVGALPGAFS